MPASAAQLPKSDTLSGCYRVDSRRPDFVAGMIIKDGVCVEAAPIIKYFVGWNIRSIMEYAAKRGFIITEV